MDSNEERRKRLETISEDLNKTFDHLVERILWWEGPVPDCVPEEWCK